MECIHSCSSFAKHNIKGLKTLLWQRPLIPLKEVCKVTHIQSGYFLHSHYKAFLTPAGEEQIVSQCFFTLPLSRKFWHSNFMMWEAYVETNSESKALNNIIAEHFDIFLKTKKILKCDLGIITREYSHRPSFLTIALN